MRLSGHLPNSTTYRIIIQHHAQTRNLIMCLRAIEEMKRAELAPDMQTVETVVKLACEEYLPRLAHGLAIEYEQASTRQLTLECWTRVLAASAHGYYVRLPLSLLAPILIAWTERRCCGWMETCRRRWRDNAR